MTAGALILAAGFSRRFGTDKRLHRLADGELMISATLRRYQQVFSSVAVVVRDSDSEIIRHLTSQGERQTPIIIPRRAQPEVWRRVSATASARSSWEYASLRWVTCLL
ncbi:MAG: NTP transferase domain-containing protein [Gammaproteobacteria bacterium]|nr:NTP transferase domain-containing protein [Gammaproteobacteria bacterium]